MNSKLVLAIVATILASPVAVAENDKSSDRIHYKCHVSLQDKSDVVHGFVSVGKTQSEFESGLEGSMVYSADGVTGSEIESVYECAKADNSFKTKEARELEAKTPF